MTCTHTQPLSSLMAHQVCKPLHVSATVRDVVRRVRLMLKPESQRAVRARSDRHRLIHSAIAWMDNERNIVATFRL